MKFDIHFHVVGRGAEIDQVDDNVYFNPDDNNLFFTRILYGMVEKDLEKLEADLDQSGSIDTDEYFKLVYGFLKTSEELKGIVLLAMDAVYHPQTGALDEKRTDIWVSNRFLGKKVRELNDKLSKEKDPKNRNKRFYYGASVNPNRKDGMRN